MSTKIINFDHPIDKCFFGNTNIECYQQGTCKSVNNWDENQYIENSSVRTCEKLEIQSIKDSIIINSSSNPPSTSKSLIIIIIILCIIIIIIAIILYIIRKRKMKLIHEISKRNSSEIIIDGRWIESPNPVISPQTPTPSTNNVLSMSHTPSTPPAYNILPVSHAPSTPPAYNTLSVSYGTPAEIAQRKSRMSSSSSSFNLQAFTPFETSEKNKESGIYNQIL